jgi:outer membrane lipoprotein-sorting protein
MKRILPLLAGALLAPAVLCAAEFEGRITMKMTPARGQSQEIRYAIKGGKLRMEFPGQKEAVAMIVDPVKRESIMLMDEQKMYMVTPMQDLETPADKKGGEAPKLEKTGETEKILGYTAEKYISTHENTKTELWLAEGIGTFVGFSGGRGPMGGRGGPPPQGWERALAGKEFFPLRVVTHDKANKQTFKMEVTNIDKGALPDGMFAPPADYQKFDMGGMMKGMMPGIPGRNR